MVKITYTGNKFTRRRLPSGQWISWRPNKTIEVESRRLAEELSANRDFVEQKEIGPKDTGGGLKTHIRSPKRVGRPPKSRKHLDKSKQAPKEKVAKKTAKPKSLKKPKGLKKSKRAD